MLSIQLKLLRKKLINGLLIMYHDVCDKIGAAANIANNAGSAINEVAHKAYNTIDEALFATHNMVIVI
jgi:hypothetical protein